jgi:2,4-dienoyl-CoA reductase-like NADH-dependent reductase (Old Yellow Enzyme family)
VDVNDCSAGGMSEQASPEEGITYGYQAKYARDIRAATEMTTMAVGTIVHGDQAEQMLQDETADLVAIGREFLHNPNWAMDAAQKLGASSAFAIVPPSSGYWLEKRSRNPAIHPSTWQRSIRVERPR